MGAETPHHMGHAMEELDPPKLFSLRNLVFLICFATPQLILLIVSAIFSLHIYVIIHTISFFILISMIIDQRIPMFMSSSLINIFCFILFIKMRKFEDTFAIKEFVFFYISGSIVYVFNICCSILLYLIVDKDAMVIFVLNSINDLIGYTHKHKRSISKSVDKIVEDYNKILTLKGEIFGREFFDAIDWPLLGFSKIKSLYDDGLDKFKQPDTELNNVKHLDQCTQTVTNVIVKNVDVAQELPIVQNLGVQNPYHAITKPVIDSDLLQNDRISQHDILTSKNTTPYTLTPHTYSEYQLGYSQPSSVKSIPVCNELDQSPNKSLSISASTTPLNMSSNTPINSANENYEMGFCVHHPSNVDHKVELYESDFTVSNSTVLTSISMPITPGKPEIPVEVKQNCPMETNHSAFTEDTFNATPCNENTDNAKGFMTTIKDEEKENVNNILPNIEMDHHIGNSFPGLTPNSKRGYSIGLEGTPKSKRRDSIIGMDEATPKSRRDSIKGLEGVTPKSSVHSIKSKSRATSVSMLTPQKDNVLTPSKANVNTFTPNVLTPQKDYVLTPSKANVNTFTPNVLTPQKDYVLTPSKANVNTFTPNVLTPQKDNVLTPPIVLKSNAGSRSSSVCRSKIPNRHGVPGRIDPDKYNSSPAHRHTSIRRYSVNDNNHNRTTPSNTSKSVTPNRDVIPSNREEIIPQNNAVMGFENCVGGSGLGRLDNLWNEIASNPVVTDNLDPITKNESPHQKQWTPQHSVMTKYSPKKHFGHPEF